jgi:hypothetical protein
MQLHPLFMRKTFLFLVILATACSHSSKQKEIHHAPVYTRQQQATELNDYPSVLSVAKSFKQKGIVTDSFETIFSRFIVDSIIPYWYGTKWNFYGTTEEPNKGTIACGYFVTTVLRDAGLRINRIKLAQAASEEMIRTVCIRKSIKRYSHTPMQSFITELLQLENGLYVVGLDFHTGFIYHNNDALYFIHSSYQTPQCVIKQNAGASSILASSKYKVIGKVNLKL